MVVFRVGSVADVNALRLAQFGVLFDIAAHFRGQVLDVAVDHADASQVVKEAHVRML